MDEITKEDAEDMANLIPSETVVVSKEMFDELQKET